MSEDRILRSRILAQAERRDSGYSPPSEGTPAMIGQVYDGGSMPTSGDHYFLVHPCEIDGDASEGAAGTVVADTSSSVAVAVIGNRTPRVGDYLRCFHVGGRWVAESRSSSCVVRICVTCSDNVDSPAVVGATVTIRDPDDHSVVVDSGTTDSDGCANLDVNTAGDYEVRIASSGRPTTNRVDTFACNDLKTYDLCGQSCELCDPGTADLVLTLSVAFGDPVTYPLVFQGPSESGFPSWLGVGQGSQIFTVQCSDPQGWILECTYFDTTISGGVTCPLFLLGDCDGPAFTVSDLGSCTNFTSSTGYKLPITITL